MGLLHGRKDGQIPLAGRSILAVYFCLSTLARLAAIVIFLTPLLGLFDILGFGKTASMAASNDTVYDLPQDRSVVTLNQAWSSFALDRHSELLSETPAAFWSYVAIPPVLLVAHFALTIIVRRCYEMCSSNSNNWLLLLASLIASPPQFQPENYYWQPEGLLTQC